MTPGFRLLFLGFVLCCAVFPARPSCAANQADDATSAFSTNLFSQLPPQEYASYLRQFYYAMEYTETGKEHRWHTTDTLGRSVTARGIIIPQAQFVSDAKVPCRPFAESYVVGGKTQTLRGMACRRTPATANEAGEWCKLRVGAVYSCKFEKKDGLEGVVQDTQSGINQFKSNSNLFFNNLNQATQSLFR